MADDSKVDLPHVLRDLIDKWNKRAWQCKSAAAVGRLCCGECAAELEAVLPLLAQQETEPLQMELGEGVPKPLYRQIHECAVAKQLNVTWLCDLYRKGHEDGKRGAAEATLAQQNEKALAEAIVKRIASYVRGFYASPPTGVRSEAWGALQYVADMIEAQSFAIVQSAALDQPRAEPQTKEP